MRFEIGFGVWQEIFSHQGLCGVGCLAVKKGDRINLKTQSFGKSEYLESQKMCEDCANAIILIAQDFFEPNEAVACDLNRGYYATFSSQGKSDVSLAQKALTEIVRKEKSWGRY